MNKIYKIKTKSKNYIIIIENNSIVKNIIDESKKSKTIVIIDSKLNKISDKIKSLKNIHVIQIPGGEKIKSFKSYSDLCNKILKLKIDRSTLIIAIGGGTIGDLCGFIASTLLRGIKFILMPTTLLSQVDSSIGGKNGINTSHGKNLIGTFLQPDKVIIDPTLLLTLPKREIKSGYAEILKHALIKDKKFFNWLDINFEKIISLENEYIMKAILKSIQIKAFFIDKDERERLINSNSRAILNFGHTFGHAIETMNSYSNNLTHGEAISIGMSLASKVSNKIGILSNKDLNKIILHLKKISLPVYDRRIKQNKLYNLMLSDKKNINNKIKLVLLKRIGKAYLNIEMKKEEIKRILN